MDGPCLGDVDERHCEQVDKSKKLQNKNKYQITNNFINSPVHLLVLLALDHPHLDHILPGVDLIQALLQLLHQKVLSIKDESNASDLKVPTCKLDSSATLRDTTVLNTSPSSQLNAFSIGYRYYAVNSQA